MRTCTIDGCTKPHRARGLCPTHYNQQLPNRHRKVTIVCAECGKPTQKDAGRDKRYTNVYCGLACRDTHRHRMYRAEHMALVRYTPPPAWARPRHALKQPKVSTRTFAGGKCRVCQADFLCLFGSLTCSAPCKAVADRALKREAKHRRRARQRDAYRAPVFRITVYQRDQWTCQLCYLPIDRTQAAPQPLAPTIDHIIALARGGTHEPANVQTAHFICNALKGDRVA